MRYLVRFLLLALLTTACQKDEKPTPVAEVPEHRYWPLQKYARWIFTRLATGSTTRDVVIGPKTTEIPDYFPFAKAPFPSYGGLNLNENGDLELIWKYLDVKTKGVLLPQILPQPGARWYSTPAYFHLIDDRAGIAIYDSVRFEVIYNRFWDSYTIPFTVPISYNWVVDVYIRTEIWHIFEEKWEEPFGSKDHRLFLARDYGPIVINNGFYSEFLWEARTHY